MGDLLLADDPIYSRFTDTVEMTEEQAKAANLRGMGRVRDLREAAVLSEELAADLKAYSAAETKEAQKAMIDGLIDKWAKTDPLYGQGVQFSAPYIQTANEGRAIVRAGDTGNGNMTVSGILLDPPKEYLDLIDSALAKIAALDSFTGRKSNTIYVTSNQEIANFHHTSTLSYNQLAEGVYKGLLFQTRLKPYLEEISFTIENNEFKLDYSKVLAKFNEVHAKDPQKAFVDLGEFIAYGKPGADLGGLSGLFAEYVFKASEAGHWEKYAEALGKDALDIQKGTEQNDSLSSKKSFNYLSGGAGDDSLSGQSSIDILDGGSGNDKLYGYGGADTLFGGTDNDYMEGGSGADTYVFAKGNGQDVIYDSSSDGKEDTIRLSDITVAETKFRKDGANLILSGYNGTDSVTVENFFSGGSYEIERFEFKDQSVTLEELRKNGMTFTGTDSNETISSWSGKSIIYAGKGNDSISTYNADDILDGGEGNDTLSAGGGNDVLIGGAGNDYLEGGREADIYEFAKGHGHDVIYEDDGNGYSIDTIRLNNIMLAETKFTVKENNLILSGYHEGDSITIKDFFPASKHQIEAFQFEDKLVTLAEFSQEGIKLEGTNGDDSMSMYHWYHTTFSYQTSVDAGEGNDFVSTADATDFLDGGAGDDTLYGNGGDDTLVGGAGNDYLEGGNGADTYVFEKGHGKDVVCGKPDGDMIQLNDVTLQEVRFSKNNKDLILFGYNENDSITLKDFFVNMSYEIERFKFKDQEVVFFDLIRSYEGVKLEGTDGDDSISFSPTRWLGKGIVDAGDGDDTVTGTTTADILEGGAGNDKLYGKLSVDKLIGGTGDDYLEGGEDGDIYVFAKGHGHDVIYEGKDKSKDEMILTDINLDETQYRKDGNDLILFGYNEGDSITVKDFFSDINHQIELFEFKDESVFAPEFDKYLSTGNNMTNSMSVFSFKYDEEKTSLEAVVG
ncbi:calcium-binding protein [Neisseria sp. 83E34]|uniref:calcium-binding protein n=1 Tax=Neisseria sp. 83E34 TaxID=1692264 RepID=UPI0006CE6E49|nr:calcium-binding protein [Neisseria sp. 83E34]